MSKEDEELRLLYQITIDDIRYSKQQQWNSIYLTLLAIAGVVSLFLGIQSKAGFSENLKWFLIIICSVIALFGIIFIGKYQSSMAKYRYKKDNIWKKFSEDIQKLDSDCLSWEYYKRDFIFVLLFWILIIASLILAIWIIYNIN